MCLSQRGRRQSHQVGHDDISNVLNQDDLSLVVHTGAWPAGLFLEVGGKPLGCTFLSLPSMLAQKNSQGQGQSVCTE